MIPGQRDTGMKRYRDTELQYMDIVIQGYRVTGCRDTGIRGYRVTGIQ